MKVHKGDKVLVIAGKDKGKTSKVIKALPSARKIVVEDVNIKKKHIRPKKEGQKGQIVQLPAPIGVSNVKVMCPKCEKATRLGYKKLENNKKVRICKKCNAEI